MPRCTLLFGIALLMGSAAVSAEELRWRMPAMIDAAVEQPAEAESSPPLLLSEEPSTFDDAAPYLSPQEFAPATESPGPTPIYNPPPSRSFFPASWGATLGFIERWERDIQPLESYVTHVKPGAFQKLGFVGAWSEGGDDDRAPGMTDLSSFATFSVPFPIREWPLLITPGFDTRQLAGPQNRDLPGVLYDGYLDVTWNLWVTPRSTSVFSVAPGYYSDLQHSSGHAFRVTGKWVGTYDLVRNRLTIMQGTIYLGRDDVGLLTVGGVSWTPRSDMRFDIIFPNPRATFRVRHGYGFEDWMYLGADFYGGQTWAMQRVSGSVDRVTITENRAVLGWERKVNGGAGLNLEAGWMFDRKVRYLNDRADDFAPDPTFYLRMGLTL